jgi:hypothetical protein
MGALNSIQITNTQDIWLWNNDATRIFSVKLAYSIVVLDSTVDVGPPAVSDLILAKVWKS